MENFADPSVGVASGELVIRKDATREEAGVGLYWRYEIRIRVWLSELDSIFGQPARITRSAVSWPRRFPRTSCSTICICRWPPFFAATG